MRTFLFRNVSRGNDFNHNYFHKFHLDGLLSKHMEKEIALGIDIGGTYTKVGLIDKLGNILATEKFETEAKKPFTGFIKNLKDEIDSLKDGLRSEQKIIGVGIGAPNANTHTGAMEYPPNFRWGDIIPIATTIGELYGLPVTITNDANAAAVGELEFGMGKGMQNFVVLTLGTGLGSGIISHGELLIGQNGMAGELGHVNVNSNPHARECNCGLQGCLETYVSVTGMRRTIFELIAEMRDDSDLRSISFDDMTGEIISEAALKGDAIALEAFKQTAEILGIQMADTAAHLDPEAYILLGGLSKAGDILVKPTVEAMEEHIFHAYKGKIKVMISDTPGDHTVLGPGALAWRMFNNH